MIRGCGIPGHEGATAPGDVFDIRGGTADDAATVLGLFDAAVRWQTTRGLDAQWGQTPFSQVPAWVEAVTGWATSDGLRLAARAGQTVGALVLGSAPAYVPPATERELYILALVSCRCALGRGAGRTLLRVADQEAHNADVSLLRVDCFAGNDGHLVRYYERAGFTATGSFTVGSWPGTVLERQVGTLAASSRMSGEN